MNSFFNRLLGLIPPADLTLPGNLGRDINCAGYALCKKEWIEPSGFKKQGGDFPLSCDEWKDWFKRNHSAEDLPETGCCKSGYHQIEIYIDTQKSTRSDYNFHVTREADDGRWYHKPGEYPAQLVDPAKWKSLGYGKYKSCGKLCAPDK